jgi:preprotein translocase subunit SecY
MGLVTVSHFLIFTGIVAGFQDGVYRTYMLTRQGEIHIITLAIFAVVALLIVAGVVAIQEGQRKIPVQYAKSGWPKNVWRTKHAYPAES